MLNDIQRFARQLLNQSTIDKIGHASAETLNIFGSHKPVAENFAHEARRQLALSTGIMRGMHTN